MQYKSNWSHTVPGGLITKKCYSDLTDMSSVKAALNYIHEYGYHNKGAVTRFFHTSDGRIYVKVTNGRTFKEFYSEGRKYYYFCQRIEMYRIK